MILKDFETFWSDGAVVTAFLVGLGDPCRGSLTLGASMSIVHSHVITPMIAILPPPHWPFASRRLGVRRTRL